MRTALAQPARVVDPIGSIAGDDDSADTLSHKVEALRRLSPVKMRVLGLIADEMLREAQSKKRSA